MKRNQKLTFQKKEFRILDPRALARIKGGDGEKEMVLDGSMELHGELAPRD
jgi:hypothetical protein